MLDKRIIIGSILIIIVLSIQMISSTNIILSVANTENLEDTYVDEANPTTVRGAGTTLNYLNVSGNNDYSLYKFNITSIPDGQVITEAKLSIYVVSNLLDANTEGWYAVPYWVYQNFSWVEDTMTWNGRPVENTNYYNVNASYKRIDGTDDPPAGAYVNFTVTSIVNNSYLAGEDNTTIYLTMKDMFGSPTSSDYIQTYQKEQTGTTSDPKLYITYIVDNFPQWDNLGANVGNYTTINMGDTWDVSVHWTDDVGLSTPARQELWYNNSGAYVKWAADNSLLIDGWNNISWGAYIEALGFTGEWFVNATINDTSNHFNYTDKQWVIVVADTCTPPASGNWTVSCVNNCYLQNDIKNLDYITFTGMGTASFVNYNMTFKGIDLSTTDCKVYIENSLWYLYNS